MKNAQEKLEFIIILYPNNVESLTKKLIEAQKNNQLRVVVLILNFAEIEKGFTNLDNMLIKAMKNFSVPIIAAVKGTVSKNAFSLIEHSALCIAADSAKFLLAENEIDAEQALERGLINEVVSPSEIELKATVLAKQISELAPLAIQACLKTVNRGLETNLKKGLAFETELFAQMFSTEDMREGTRAFFEKRRPIFEGK